MKFFTNQKGETSFFDLILVFFVVSSIGSCIFGDDDDKTEVAVQKTVPIPIEEVKTEEKKEIETEALTHQLQGECIDGKHTINVEGETIYLCVKDDWDDYKPLKCKE